MLTFLLIAQIVVAVTLGLSTLLQVKGGGLGGIFGQADTVFRTKRGVEKTLFQMTIVLVALLVLISIWVLLII
ncbi:preprotein translocase subunit SecG [Dehalogenimonas sp. 4OHTPN]|uniref:Protein-export membrane protein SecG n=1 Tax=Dehalogenimonas sp. 4OHTPN TaxID=3166643 RepID=A0AAU8GCU9_9CHLR